MRKENYVFYGMSVKRVTKKTANKLFENGETIYILPSNANGNSPWYASPCFVNKENLIANNEECNFRKYVFIFTQYNCINNETGYYPKYFVKER